MSQKTEEYLAHYGVVGMKWGKKGAASKSPTNEISIKATPQKPAHADAVKTLEIKATARTSGTKALSNAELQTAITRMNLEQQYSRLSPSSKSRGQKIVTDALANTGKQLLSEYTKSAAKAGVELAFKAAFKK